MNIKDLYEENKAIDRKIEELKQAKETNTEAILAMFGDIPPTGTLTKDCGDYKAKVSIRTTYRVNVKDMDNFEKVFADCNAEVPIKIKETKTLDTKGLKWYKENNPVIANEASKYISSSTSTKVDIVL